VADVVDDKPLVEDGVFQPEGDIFEGLVGVIGDDVLRRDRGCRAGDDDGQEDMFVPVAILLQARAI